METYKTNTESQTQIPVSTTTGPTNLGTLNQPNVGNIPTNLSQNERKNRSWVWDHFTKSETYIDKAICNYCTTKIAYQNSW